MALTQVKELLECTARCHGKLADFYLRIQENSDSEAVRELAKDLAWHENELTHEIDEFTRNEDYAINRAWVQLKPELDPDGVLGDLHAETPDTREALLAKGIELDGNLVNFLHRLAESAPSEGIRNVFRALERKEIEDQKKLANMGRAD